MTKSPLQHFEQLRDSRKNIMINNFLGGLSWAVGTTVGLTVVLTLLGLILRQISLVPVIGSFVVQITDFVSQNSRSF